MEGEKIILGIDPGTAVMGFGLVKVVSNSLSLITLDELILHKLPNHSIKLKRIFEKTLAIIEQYHPDELAIEAPFFGKNVQSMLKLGRAQGVAMAAGLYRDIPIFEYLPKKVKASITGNGGASKEQVAGTLRHLMKFKKMPKNLDSTDGLAVAYCHYLQRNSIFSKQKYSGWQAFTRDNPDKIL